MIPLLTREAVRRIDVDAVDRLGVPSIVLMENAARGAYDAIVARFPTRLERVVIVGGPGQNGGDGWALARHLHNRGHAPTILILGAEEKVRGDARINLAAAVALGIETIVASEVTEELVASRLRHASLIVDAIFGTGLDRPLVGAHAEMIRLFAHLEAPCVALDLPSGIDANTGQVLGVAPECALTVTFAAMKRGLAQFPGAHFAGEVICASIGVPAPETSDALLWEPSDAARVVEQRPRDSHKGTAGHVLVVGGSAGKTGAVVLAGRGALRAGAGLVTIATESQASLDPKVVELMTEPIMLSTGLEAVLQLSQGKGAVVIGPGLGLSKDARLLAIALSRELVVPTVIDADALTAIAEGNALSTLRNARGPRVLTPHPGEAARLLGVTSADVQADRYGAAIELANASGQVVVLKGAGTIVAYGDAMAVTSGGTPALGVAGTGDVLAGALAALLIAVEHSGERLGPSPAFDAAAAAAVLHALAGEMAARSDRGLLAHEVADAIPVALEAARR